MVEERKTFTIPDENGKLVEYEMLFELETEEPKKTYIAYTDNSKDENGRFKVFAARTENGDNDEERKLFPIETDEEWKLIEDVLTQSVEEFKEGGSEQ